MPTVFNHKVWNIYQDLYDVSVGKSTAAHIEALVPNTETIRPVMMPETAQEVGIEDLDSEGRYIGKPVKG